jgi:hypothetical protein
MFKDEAIDELRAIRQRISLQYEDDVTQFLNHYRNLDKKYRHRIKKSSVNQATYQIKAPRYEEEAYV